VFVIVGGARRLLTHTPAVSGLPVLIVSGIAALTMTGGAVILGADAAKEDLHMRSVLLDTVTDALSAAAVAALCHCSPSERCAGGNTGGRFSPRAVTASGRSGPPNEASISSTDSATASCADDTELRRSWALMWAVEVGEQ